MRAAVCGNRRLRRPLSPGLVHHGATPCASTTSIAGRTTAGCWGGSSWPPSGCRNWPRRSTPAGSRSTPADPWRLSVVMGALVPAELAHIAAFQAAWEPRGVLADSIEYRVASVGQVIALGDQIPHRFRRYFEVPQVGPYRRTGRRHRSGRRVREDSHRRDDGRPVSGRDRTHQISAGRRSSIAFRSRRPRACIIRFAAAIRSATRTTPSGR